MKHYKDETIGSGPLPFFNCNEPIPFDNCNGALPRQMAMGNPTPLMAMVPFPSMPSCVTLHSITLQFNTIQSHTIRTVSYNLLQYTTTVCGKTRHNTI